MAILIDERTRVVVQGITGHQGSFHTGQMLDYGTRVVAGVSPGKEGQEVRGVPVYDTVEAAVEKHGATASVVFVPAPFAKDAVLEALDAGIKLVVVITEHVPLHDAMEIMARARLKGATVVGPNTFGVISPGKSKIGIMPNAIYTPGRVGIVARSGTLSYEIAASLSHAGFGQSTVVGMGGDRVVGLSFIDVLKLFEQDKETEAVVLVGEIGGTAEEEAAEYIKGMSKPVVAYLAGKHAPPGKRMGHAGAIIERGRGTYQSKVEALEAAGARVAALPWQVADLVREVLR
ncbi:MULTISPECIES: succinate--CoA ligase subunit alpha [Thermaerobacter]|uniref:Succinate--CoA ligase [ADP-forming] subunit alpha n=1 Tax=Thermaerobacter composti TaxID=554949 RepID=A0ABZ0QNF5_9FIRM|nr:MULTISPECIES: succinate--CoA ligase subunit alpha [Thermaerobacter]PZN07145.1 MAG: succinate--CoA ligase subunit alpha [Bacillota bacterium]QBS38029.1 succinate--CoA ligase subunit alpha [Thermaerobacter sp. FW80]WPD18037.1 succinate--CoA ligase subunit alpha [Thermaerobacter composti]